MDYLQPVIVLSKRVNGCYLEFQYGQNMNKCMLVAYENEENQTESCHWKTCKGLCNGNVQTVTKDLYIFTLYIWKQVLNVGQLTTARPWNTKSVNYLLI